MKFTVLAILLLVLLGCKKDDPDILPETSLKGKWVEVKTRADTLIFENWDGMEVVLVGRGKEMRGKHLLPKFGSGPYEYKLKTGSISLYYMLSSLYGFEDYSFKHKGNSLIVGNFYDPTLNATLTFERLD